MTDETTVDTTEEETDAGWAYRYGQEARLREQIENRYYATIYDVGITIAMFKELLSGLSQLDEDERETWLSRLPHFVDQLFDAGMHVQCFLGWPIGSMTENELLIKSIERVKSEAKGTKEPEHGDQLDAQVEKFLRSHWEEFKERYDTMLKNEPPLHAGLKQRKTAHRQECIGEFLPLFIRLMTKNGAPEDAIKAAMQLDTTH